MTGLEVEVDFRLETAYISQVPVLSTALVKCQAVVCFAALNTFMCYFTCYWPKFPATI